MQDTQAPLWTLEQGVQVARLVELAIIPHQAHVALGGGTLHKGESNKDLDLYIYPHDADPLASNNIVKALELIGLTDWRTYGFTNQADSHKEVWGCRYQDKRIDVFFLKA